MHVHSVSVFNSETDEASVGTQMGQEMLHGVGGFVVYSVFLLFM